MIRRAQFGESPNPSQTPKGQIPAHNQMKIRQSLAKDYEPDGNVCGIPKSVTFAGSEIGQEAWKSYPASGKSLKIFDLGIIFLESEEMPRSDNPIIGKSERKLMEILWLPFNPIPNELGI